MKIKNNVINFLVAALAVIIITYFYPQLKVNHYKFEEGRPWNYAQLIAPFDIPIRPDSATVLSVRDSLERSFAPVFSRDNEVVNTIITNLIAHWAQIDGDSEPTEYDDEMRRRTVTFVRQAYMKDVVDNDFGERMREGSLSNIRILQNNVVRKIPTKNIVSPQIVLSELIRSLDTDTVSAAKWVERNEVSEALTPNLVYEKDMSDNLYNADLTQLNARMGAVISGVIQQGQTVIDKGAIITSQDYTNIKTYEHMLEEQLSRGHRSKWIVLLGQFLYVSLIIVSLLAFLRFSAQDVWNRKSAMIFIFISIVLFFIIGIVLDASIDSGIYLVPFAIIPVLMMVFFNTSTAIFTSLALILLCAGTVSFPLEFITEEVFATVAAVFSLKELNKRSQLLRTSLFVLGSYLLSYVAIDFMMNGSTSDLTWHMVGILAVSATLTSMAYILMVAVEKIFGFVSVVTLSELTDTNSPLLRELSLECPGTFQHSIAVSHLASDAAIRIGANEQLVRAGALYHDIGKISNPNFFTENQRGVNPHDALPAEQSARVIISHVADGVQRAEKEGLPDVIKTFIREHHGKGKAKYFYFNCCKAHPNEQIDPRPFTYPGPNPQSRETSVLMMADSVEAASRSLKEHSQEAIAELVNKIIDGQIADGLHNESSLMFRDVQTIKEAFIKRLMTIYHSRIVYPDDPNKKQ